MKAKISRGAGFRGLLNYLYGPGEENKPGRAVLVHGAGNVFGKDPREIASEFSISRKIRPDIKRPVWHCSLSLPPGENLDDERWAEVARDFLVKMGLDPETRQWHCVRHTDQAHSHIHLVVSRVSLAGSVWYGKNDVKQAISVAQELEKLHGLQLTPSFEEGGEKKSLGKGEVGRFIRTGKVPDRVILHNKIDAARKNCPDFSTFVNRLKELKVSVIPAGKSGQMQGISFRLAGSDPFSGSSLGKAYVWQRIAHDVCFDAVRDAELIAQLRLEASKETVAGGIGPAGPIQSVGQDLYRSRGQVAPEKARERYFQRKEDGTWVSRRNGWVAFRELESQIIICSRRDVAIRAGLTTAAEKFGSPLEVSGEVEFRRKAWLFGSQMGLQVKGYEPTVDDLAELAGWREKCGRVVGGSNLILPAKKEVQLSYMFPVEEKSWVGGSHVEVQVEGYEPAADNLAALAGWREKCGRVVERPDLILSARQELQLSYMAATEEMNTDEHDRKNEQRIRESPALCGSCVTEDTPGSASDASDTRGAGDTVVAKAENVTPGNCESDNRRNSSRGGAGEQRFEVGYQSLQIVGECSRQPEKEHGGPGIEHLAADAISNKDNESSLENRGGCREISQGDKKRIELDAGKNTATSEDLRHRPHQFIIDSNRFYGFFQQKFNSESVEPEESNSIRQGLGTGRGKGEGTNQENNQVVGAGSVGERKKVEPTLSKKKRVPSPSM